MRTRTLWSVATAGWLTIVAVGLSGCATMLTPSADVTTASPAWTNWFTLDWTTEPADARGGRRLAGYVHSHYGEDTHEMQLLTQALDRSGAVVGQRVTWVSLVPRLSRTYFDVPDLPQAEQYRVTVWAFTFFQGDGWR